MTSLGDLRRMFSGGSNIVCAVRPPGFHHIGAFHAKSLTQITCPYTWLEPYRVQSPNDAWNAAQNIKYGKWPGYPPNPMGDWYASGISPRFTASILLPKRSGSGFSVKAWSNTYALHKIVQAAKQIRKEGGVFIFACLGDGDSQEATALDRASYVLGHLGLEPSFPSKEDAVMALRGSVSLLLLTDPSITHWDGVYREMTPTIYPPLLYLGLQPGEDPL